MLVVSGLKKVSSAIFSPLKVPLTLIDSSLSHSSLIAGDFSVS